MNKRFLQYLLISLAIFGLGACNKELPQEIDGTVQFKFDGTIGGNTVLLEAGKNDYALNTYYTDDGIGDLLLMSGSFTNKIDSTADVLSFNFYGYNAEDNSNLLQNVFQLGNIYSTSTDTVASAQGNFQFQFDALNNPAFQYQWDFGDGSTATGASVIHTYPGNSMGSMPIKLIAAVPLNNCLDSVSNNIDFNNLACQNYFETLPSGLDSFVFRAPSGFSNYTWLINGVNQASTDSFFSQGFFNPIRYIVELIATQGSCVSSWQAVITPDSINGCLAAFKFKTLQQPVFVTTQRPRAKTAIITYSSKGKTYSSLKPDNSNQSGKIVFSLNSAMNYEKNTAGQNTISLKGAVDTYLYNVNNPNDSIRIVSSNVQTAVAHP